MEGSFSSAKYLLAKNRLRYGRERDPCLLHDYGLRAVLRDRLSQVEMLSVWIEEAMLSRYEGIVVDIGPLGVVDPSGRTYSKDTMFLRRARTLFPCREDTVLVHVCLSIDGGSLKRDQSNRAKGHQVEPSRAHRPAIGSTRRRRPSLHQ